MRGAVQSLTAEALRNKLLPQVVPGDRLPPIPLLPWQRQVKDECARFNVLSVGRRAGKTYLCQDLAEGPALEGLPVAWYSPTYKDMLEVWRDVKHRLYPVTERVSVQDRRLELDSGGVIEFWSLDNRDAGRGRKYARAIIDEAAMIPRLMEVFSLVIRPTLIDYTGDAWFPSTPRGLNDFWNMYRMGQDPTEAEWYCYSAPSSVNPKLPAGELEAARRTMTDLRYRQEILAEFVDMVGAVFRNVDECATATVEGPQEGRRYIAGCDLAISGDYTVVTVLDVTDPAAPCQVFLDRWTGIPWQQQLDRIVGVCDAYNVDLIEVDRTGMGDMPYDELCARMPRRQVWGVAFNAGNKQGMVQGLALSLERGTLRILPDPVQVGELKAYEADRRPSGAFTYSAPDGQHDDTVSALMLANDGATSEAWGVVAL